MDELGDLNSCAKRLRFPDALEKRFLEDYDDNSVTLCRTALAASTLIFMLFGVLDPYAIPSALRDIWFIRFGLVTPLLLLLLVVSFFPFFRRHIQPLTSLQLIPSGIGLIAMTARSRPGELGYVCYPIGLLLVCMVGYCFLRLRFGYASIANLVLVLVYLFVALDIQKILNLPQGRPIFINNLFFILSANVIGLATCYALELYARRAFVAHYLLEQERVGEQRKREKTEAMLQILGQAIGGVVHDLGNPLSTMQMGAQTMEMFLDTGDVDKETLKEFTGIITTGAEMLNHLRLSLMEQTRVLEGKPIPVDLKPVPIRQLVEAGIHYQKPRFTDGRKIVQDGEDIDIHADEMKLTTVFMNLIGNALKYSDGEVHIVWRTAHNALLIAIADEGMAGQGISQSQADQLFVAFGRLDTHAQVEGTGLGLLSARKIVEAHGGEVFIEGRADGTRTSAPFATAQQAYPSLLKDNHRTAFIVVCPLPPQSGNSMEKEADG